MNRGLFGISNEHADAIDLTTRVPGPGVMSGNAFFGFQAGQSQTAMKGDIASGSGGGVSNTFIGYQAGQQNTSGDSNVYVGYLAGQVINGSKNVWIGWSGTFIGSPATMVDSVVIGYA